MTVLAAITKTIEFEHLHCGECDMDFAVPTSFYLQRRGDGQTWYCPRGHPRCFRDSDLVRTRKLLEEANRRNSELASDLTKERGKTRKVAKELKKTSTRIHGGVCPCCNRTF